MFFFSYQNLWSEAIQQRIWVRLKAFNSVIVMFFYDGIHTNVVQKTMFIMIRMSLRRLEENTHYLIASKVDSQTSSKTDRLQRDRVLFSKTLLGKGPFWGERDVYRRMRSVSIWPMFFENPLFLKTKATQFHFMTCVLLLTLESSDCDTIYVFFFSKLTFASEKIDLCFF